MQGKFSPELTSRIIAYFRDNYDREITPEQAEMCLDSLAELFICFSRDDEV